MEKKNSDNSDSSKLKIIKVISENESFKSIVNALKKQYGEDAQSYINSLIDILLTAINTNCIGLPLISHIFDEKAWRDDQIKAVKALGEASDALRSMKGNPKVIDGRHMDDGYKHQINTLSDAWVLIRNLANKINSMNPELSSPIPRKISQSKAKRGVSDSNVTTLDTGALVRMLDELIPDDVPNRFASIANLISLAGYEITVQNARSILEYRKRPR